jgi:hypothetical protein
MFEETLALVKTKKYIIRSLAFFGFFLVIYTMLDGFNMSYQQMQLEYGSILVIVNIGINLLMAGSTALLLSLSTANVELKGKDTKGSNLGFLSVLFGVLTYGCTSCVITFFASIGIAFSVIALPLAGLPYKLLSLLLILVGLWWTKREISHGLCKVSYSN